MVDKRRKPFGDADRVLRDDFDRDIRNQSLSIAQTIKAMRRLSRLTQVEFAKHRGISLGTLKELESGNGSAKVETLNKIAAIFALEVGFVRKARKTFD